MKTVYVYLAVRVGAVYVQSAIECSGDVQRAAME